MNTGKTHLSTAGKNVDSALLIHWTTELCAASDWPFNVDSAANSQQIASADHRCFSPNLYTGI